MLVSTILESSDQLFSVRTWSHPPACQHQYWDSSGQATSQSGTQFHPPVGWLSQDTFLNTQLPQDPAPTSSVLALAPRPSGPMVSCQDQTCPLASQYQLQDSQGLQPETLGSSSAHYWAVISSRTLWVLVLNTSRQTPVPRPIGPSAREPKTWFCPPMGCLLPLNSVSPTSRWTLFSRMQHSHNLTCQDPVHPPVG